MTYGKVKYGNQEIQDTSPLTSFGVDKPNYLSQHSFTIETAETEFTITATDPAGNPATDSITVN